MVGIQFNQQLGHWQQGANAECLTPDELNYMVQSI